MATNNWNYSTSSPLPALITIEEFSHLGGGDLLADQATKQAALDAASAAIRDLCGWHVGPVMTCEATLAADGNVITLPTLGVKSIAELKKAGTPLEGTSYDFTSSGLIRLNKRGDEGDGWRRDYSIKWEAGYTTDGLKAIAAQVAVNFLVANPGINSETISGISVTYNKTDSFTSGGIRLLASDRQALEPYKIAR